MLKKLRWGQRAKLVRTVVSIEYKTAEKIARIYPTEYEIQNQCTPSPPSAVTVSVKVIRRSKMNKIRDVVIKPLEKSIYLKPQTMHFTQNGLRRTWDLLEIYDSVAIMLHNVERDTLIFVKQFRAPVYFGSIPEEDRKHEIDTDKYSPDLGITLELCAGLVDKKASLVQIAKEEILEECGYDVPISSLVKIGSSRSGVGTLGSLETTYYCEVTDEMKISQGGGVGNEFIEVIEMTIPEVKKYIVQDKLPSPPSFLFAIYWFLCNKNK